MNSAIRVWITSTGKEIRICDMETTHIRNAIAFIQRKAKEGLTVLYGGCGSEAEDMWYDEEVYFGKAVYNYFPQYNDLKKEYKHRLLKEAKDE